LEEPGTLEELGKAAFTAELANCRPTPPPGFIDELTQLQVVSSWQAIFDIFDPNNNGTLSLEQGRMFLAYFYNRNIATVLDDHVRGLNMPGASFDPPLNLDGISKKFFAPRMQQINLGKMPSARYVAEAKRFIKFTEFYWGQPALNPTLNPNLAWFGWGDIFDLLDEDKNGVLDLNEARVIAIMIHSENQDFISDADIRGQTPQSKGMNFEDINKNDFVSMLTWVQPMIDYMLEGDVKHLLSGPTHGKIFDLLNVSKSGRLTTEEAKVLLAFHGDCDTTEVPDEAIIDFFSYSPFCGGVIEVDLGGCTKEEFVSIFKRASPRHPPGCIQVMKQMIIHDLERRGLPVASVMDNFENIIDADVIPDGDVVLASEPAPEVASAPARPSLKLSASPSPERPARPSQDGPDAAPAMPSETAPTNTAEEEGSVMNPMNVETTKKSELPPSAPSRAVNYAPKTAPASLSGGGSGSGGCCVLS